VDNKPFRILALAGSLRQGSYNRGLLRAAQELAPDWVEMHFFDKTMGKMTGGRRNVQSPLDVPRLGMV
jgi:NADPH-dependent FMN reductase